MEHHELCRDYVFDTFADAFSFMTEVAKVAETMNHHPTWTNTYNLVSVCLHTHSAERVTEKDLQLAEEMDEIFLPYAAAEA